MCVLMSVVNIVTLRRPHAAPGGPQTIIEKLCVYGTPVPQARLHDDTLHELAAGTFPNTQRRVHVNATHNQEGAAWAKDKDIQEATAKGDWLGKGVA